MDDSDRKIIPMFPDAVSVEELAEEEDVTVDIFGDGRLLITCSIEAISAKLLKDVKRLQRFRKIDELDMLDFYAEAIASLVTRWNLADKAGEVIPLLADDILAKVPAKLIANIGDKVFEALLPGEGTGQTSNPSSEEKKARPARTGTRR